MSFLKVKYIRTKDDEIIVFNEMMMHIEFQHFKPKSAGFINIYINEKGRLDCKCYGESISLDIKSHEDDSDLAKRQILQDDFDF